MFFSPLSFTWRLHQFYSQATAPDQAFGLIKNRQLIKRMCIIEMQLQYSSMLLQVSTKPVENLFANRTVRCLVQYCKMTRRYTCADTCACKSDTLFEFYQNQTFIKVTRYYSIVKTLNSPWVTQQKQTSIPTNNTHDRFSNCYKKLYCKHQKLLPDF